MQGLKYLFQPDFSKIDGQACASALGQAFFSLSLGFGTIMTYASYVDKKENIYEFDVPSKGVWYLMTYGNFLPKK